MPVSCCPSLPLTVTHTFKGRDKNHYKSTCFFTGCTTDNCIKSTFQWVLVISIVIVLQHYRWLDKKKKKKTLIIKSWT